MSRSGRRGAQPYQIENEWTVGSSPQIARSRGASSAAGASVHWQSTAYRWPSGFCSACAAFSVSTSVRERTWPSARSASGHAAALSGASTRSASSSVSHMAVVCSSSTGPAGGATPGCSGTPGRRVAAMTGSTTSSSAGSTSCIHPNNGSRSSSAKVHVSCVIAGAIGQVRRWKRTTMAGNPGPAPRAAHSRSACSLSSVAWTSSPAAVTASRATMLSHAQPLRRPSQPWPPCSRKPPSPTRGQCPPGNDRPRWCRNGASSSPPCVDGLARTTCVASS